MSLKGLGALGLAPLAYAQEPAVNAVHGTWTIRPSSTAGRVDFTMTHPSERHDYQYFSSCLPFFLRSDKLPVGEFPGVDFAASGQQAIHFTISRDAGSFDFQGSIEGG